MNRPRILHVTAVGGSAWLLLRPQARAARAAGFEVAFAFSPGSTAADNLRSEGFGVFEAPISRRISPRQDYAGYRAMQKIIRNYRPAIVHTHTSKGGAIGRLAARCCPETRVIHTIHGFPFIAGQPLSTYWQYAAIEWLLSRTRTDLLLSQSQEDVALAHKYGIRASLGYPHWIGNGVNLDVFSRERLMDKPDLRLRHNLSSKSVIFVTVARINCEKGLGEMVEALATLQDKDWHWFVIGSADATGFADQLRKKIAQSKLEARVTFLGFRHDVAELLSEADWFVLPSYREGVPRSLIEAQAMGLPAIATGIRGCREVVRANQTGFLVPPRDVQALQGALLQAMSMDKEQRMKMGRDARTRAVQMFDETAVCERIMVAYRNLLEANH